MEFRVETDSMGEVKVPSNVLWGAQTQRSLMNFDISNRKFPIPFLRALIETKRACALANKELGVLDPKIADAIIKATETVLKDEMYDQFPLDIYQTGSGTQTNMNANEVLSNLAIKILGGEIGSKNPVHPNDHVNRGQSSNDVIPTAMYVSATSEVVHRLIPAINHMLVILESKAEEFKDVIKIGRTHLQDAVPCTLGQEFGGYAAQLKMSLTHITETYKHLMNLALGGTAVGTGLNAHPEMAEKAISILADRYEIPFSKNGNRFALLAGKDAIVATSGALKTLSVALIKIANDIRFLGSGPRVGLGELIIPANEPGSSIMPGKVNPTQAEMLVQVGAQVIGNDTAITHGGIQGYFELNLMKPMLTSNILESIDIVTRGIISFSDNCLKGLKADTNRIDSLVEKSLMLVTALTTYSKDGHIPYPYDKAASIAKRAFREGLTIREVLRADGILTDSEIEEALDLRRMVR